MNWPFKKHWTFWCGIAFIAYVLCFAAFTLYQPWGEGVGNIVTDFGTLPLSLFAGLICLAVRFRGAEPRLRRGWTLIGLGMLCFTVGNALLAYRDIIRHLSLASPTEGDVFFLLDYVFLFAGLLSFSRPKLDRLAFVRVALDAAIIVAAVALFSWLYAISGIVTVVHLNPLGVMIDMSYPTIDLGLLWIVLVLYFSTPREAMRTHLRLLLTSGLIIVSADTLYAYLSAHGVTNPADTTAVLWLMAVTAATLAALFQHRALDSGRSTLAPAAQDVASPVKFSQLVLPYLALIIVFARLIAGVFTSQASLRQLGLIVGATVVLALIIVRQLVALRETGELNVRLQLSSMQLQERIAQQARAEAALRQSELQLKQRIEQQEQAEAALRQSEQKFRSLIEQSPDSIVLTDEEGRIIEYNPGRTQVSGLARDVALGGYVWDEMFALAPPEKHTTDGYEELRTNIQTFLSAGAELPSVTYERDIMRPDRMRRTLQSLIFAIPTIRGRMMGAITRDITERHQMEAEMRAALARERELNDLKSRFISMTSHEFRTPLAGILSSAELLERYRERWPAEKQVRHLHQIQAATKHMTQLLEDILTIGKAEAGRLEFQPAPLDLAQFCQDLVEEMQRLARPGQIIQYCAQDLEASAWLDHKLLRQILANLLSNALKYSPDGSPVRFSASRGDGQVVFSVADQGIGIPPDDQIRLFETFHRATNVGTTPGTGLGLAIVKKAVDLHGGRIVCTSAVGAGTTFTVSLPVNSGYQE